MKIRALRLTLFVMTAATVAVALQEPGQTTLKGYLADRRYAADLLSYESLTQKARKYTRQRALTKEADESGYGIVSGNKFYPFDAKGNELALKMVKESQKTSGFNIEVTGTMAKDTGLSKESSSGKWEPSRDRLGRPTYDNMPNSTQSSSATYTFGKHGGEKFAVETLKEIETTGTKQ